MSSNLPLRAIRIPALQRQCLFQRRTFSTTPSLALSSTLPRLRQGTGRTDKSFQRAAARNQKSPAPAVTMDEAQSDTRQMAEDIGLLSGTFVVGRNAQLLKFWKSSTYQYYWQWVKRWVTGVYSRIVYKRCIYKKRFWVRIWPVRDHAQIRDVANKLYQQVLDNFAKGNVASLKRFCLPPLVEQMKARIAARGSAKIKWTLVRFKKTKVVSHRAQPLGQEMPDSAYRQVVLRIESIQTLGVEHTQNPYIGIESDGESNPGHTQRAVLPRPKWEPENVKAMRTTQEPERVETNAFVENSKWHKKGQKSVEGNEWVGNGEEQKVVEYLVLQKRLIRGKEEDWKVQGFTSESTPESLRLEDEYWRNMVLAQAKTT